MELARPKEEVSVEVIARFVIFRDRCEVGQEMPLGIGTPNFDKPVYPQGPLRRDLRREPAPIFLSKLRVVLL